MPKSRNSEMEPTGSENLNEKDRKLNMLSMQFEQIVNSLNSNAYRLIKVADSEIPDEHAEVHTDTLSQIKEQIKALNQLILDIEKVEGIIDITPERKLLEE